MLRIVIDRAQSGGDQISIVDTNNNKTVLMSVIIDQLPEKDDNQIWEIGLENDEFGSGPAIWKIKDLTK